VGAFLDGKIGFGDIAVLVDRALQEVPNRGIETVDGVRAADREARASAHKNLSAI